MTTTELIHHWRDQAVKWAKWADDARNQEPPDYPMAHRRGYRAEVYEICADALEDATGRCPATTQHTMSYTAMTVGVQCKYERGHNGDHAGRVGFSENDVFWPQEQP